MKKVKLGSFFGKNMFLETEEVDTFDYVKRWENWRESEKKQAVMEYKDDLFFKQAEEKSKQMKKNLWYKIGKFLYE